MLRSRCRFGANCVQAHTGSLSLKNLNFALSLECRYVVLVYWGDYFLAVYAGWGVIRYYRTRQKSEYRHRGDDVQD